MKVWIPRLVPVTLGMLLWAGCSGDSDYQEFSADDIVHHDHSEGPHGGHIIELTAPASHGEVVFDEESRTLTVYLLGDDAETAQPLKTDTVVVEWKTADGMTPLELKAVGDSADGASQFELSGDGIPEDLHDIEDLVGEVTFSVDGKDVHGEILHDHGDDEGDSHDEHGDEGDGHDDDDEEGHDDDDEGHDDDHDGESGHDGDREDGDGDHDGEHGDGHDDDEGHDKDHDESEGHDDDEQKKQAGKHGDEEHGEHDDEDED